MTYAEHGPERHLANASVEEPSDFGHFICREFHRSVSTAHLLGVTAGTTTLTPCVASLRDSIGDVLALGADKQMGRVNTGRVVTAVTDTQARRNGTFRELPGIAVGKYPLGAIPDKRVAGAMLQSGSVARPTLVWSPAIHFGPESFFRSKLRFGHSTSLGSVARDRSEADTLPGPVYFTPEATQ